MPMKKVETFDEYYKRIGVSPAVKRTVTQFGCPTCGKWGILTNHYKGAPVVKKRNWPKGVNYFRCSNCGQNLWVEIADNS